MGDTSAAVEEPKGEAAAAAPESEAPPEGCAACGKGAPAPPEGEPEEAPPGQPHGWLLDLLDDVRYLISCTNWY